MYIVSNALFLTANITDLPLWLRDDDDDDDDHVLEHQVHHVQDRTEPTSSSPIPMLLHTSTSTSGISYIVIF
jgi:hypothetical protein